MKQTDIEIIQYLVSALTIIANANNPDTQILQRIAKETLDTVQSPVTHTGLTGFDC